MASLLLNSILWDVYSGCLHLAGEQTEASSLVSHVS